MIKTILILAAVAVVCWLLYDQGYLIMQSKSAVSFVGSQRGNSARFTGCSGYIKRIVRFREEGRCTFALDAELSKGDLSVELLDGDKNQLMRLDCANPRADVTVEQKKKYTLVIRFASATGSYTLRRE